MQPISIDSPAAEACPNGRRNAEPQCPKIKSLLGCQSGKFELPKDNESGKISKMWDINFIYAKNRGNFSVIVLVAVLWQTLMSKHQMRAGNSFLKIRSESGELSTLGCHFPPKSTNFGMLPNRQNGLDYCRNACTTA